MKIWNYLLVKTELQPFISTDCSEFLGWVIFVNGELHTTVRSGAEFGDRPSVSAMQAILDTFGAEGWELVSANSTKDYSGESAFTFKRLSTS